MHFKKATQAQDIKDKINPLIEDSIGDLQLKVNQFLPIEKATEDSFIFVMSKKGLESALNSKAACVLAHSSSKTWWEENKTNKCVLFSKNPELAAREVKKSFVFTTPYRAPIKGIHPSAIVPKSCEVSKDVTIGPHAVLGENCRISEGVFIGANAVIEENVTIGQNTTVHPLAYIGHSCVVGNNCEIMPAAVVGSEGYGYAHDHLGNHYRMPHTGRVILEDDVHIGAGSAIDRGTIDDSIIGQGTKIDNQCHFAHNSKIGKNGLVTAQFVNAGSATIGDNFICGGKSVVAGHINVGDNIQLAALTALANDLKEPGQYGGYPVQPLRDFLKNKATSVHLVEMRKQLRKLMKKVFPEDYN